jgi:hypothetical protein
MLIQLLHLIPGQFKVGIREKQPRLGYCVSKKPYWRSFAGTSLLKLLVPIRLAAQARLLCYTGLLTPDPP